jgi:hypothetical protein
MGGKLVKSIRDSKRVAAMLDEGFGMSAMKGHKLWMFC